MQEPRGSQVQPRFVSTFTVVGSRSGHLLAANRTEASSIHEGSLQ